MIGIVAEFNPFHLGHSYLIASSELLLGKHDTVVACMSGDFVQRGEPAIRDKFERARKAVESGADLVIELPLPWCLSSAEGFARGGVGLLRAIGCDTLAFGSECGDADALRVKTDPDEIKAYMKLHPECTYPRAMAEVSGSDVLNYPNNLLGHEYIKYSGDMNIITVKRIGEHDGAGSAMEIRKTMSRPKLETAIVSRLKMFDRDYYNGLPDSDNGAGNRLYEAALEYGTLEEIYGHAKTRRYTMSRIRRMAMCAALGIRSGDNAGAPPYARILAFNDKGREELKNIRSKSSVPLVTLPKEINNLGPECIKVFALGASSRRLYSMGTGDIQPGLEADDWKCRPEIVQSAQKSL